jgi:hypothetical protein
LDCGLLRDSVRDTSCPHSPSNLHGFASQGAHGVCKVHNGSLEQPRALVVLDLAESGGGVVGLVRLSVGSFERICAQDPVVIGASSLYCCGRVGQDRELLVSHGVTLAVALSKADDSPRHKGGTR